MKSRLIFLFPVLCLVLLGVCSSEVYAAMQPVGDGWWQVRGTPVPPGSFAAASNSVPQGFVSTEGGPDEVTDVIKELARGLEYDPVRCHEFVYNQIRYLPYYGSLKGATRTLLDRAGNDLDQASLLRALLKASGYATRYIYGQLMVPYSATSGVSLSSWVGVDLADFATNALANGGVPFTNTGYSVRIDHVGVEVSTAGVWRALFPSYKSYIRTFGPDIAAMSGYRSDALLSAAGGAVAGNSVSGINESAVRNYMNACASQYLDSVLQWMPNASTDEILGSKRIVEMTFTNFPNALTNFSGQGNWDQVPSSLYHTIRIQHGSIDCSLALPEVSHRKLTMAYTNKFSATSLNKMAVSAPVLCSALPAATTLTNVSPAVPTSVVNQIQAVVTTNGTMKTGSTDFGINFNGTTSEWSPDIPASVFQEMSVTSSISGPDAACFGFAVGGGGRTVPANTRPIDVIRFIRKLPRGIKTATYKCKRQTTSGTFEDNYALTGAVREARNTTVSLPSAIATLLNEYKTCESTLTNLGTLNLYFNRIFISDDAQSQFAIESGGETGTGNPLAPGASRTIKVRYAATAHGTQNAKLNIEMRYDDYLYPVYSVDVRGTSFYTPNLAGSYGSAVYAAYAVPTTGCIRVFNAGVVPMTLSNLTVTGTHASVFQILESVNGVTVNAGQFRDIPVRYLANSVGTHSAIVTVSYTYDQLSWNDGFSVKGSTYSPSLMNVSSAYGVPTDGSIRVVNSGVLPMTLGTLALIGTNASMFTIPNSVNGFTVGPGQYCDISVRYLANSVGIHDAYVRVNYTYDQAALYIDFPVRGSTYSQPQALLMLDDNLIASESVAVGAATSIPCVITVDHPYASARCSYADQTNTYVFQRGALYAFVMGFGADAQGRLVEARQRRLDSLRLARLGDADQAVLSESLLIMGLRWMQETDLGSDAMGRIFDAEPIYHHRVGVMAQEQGYYIDIKGNVSFTLGWGGVNMLAKSMAHSAMEHAILEQMQSSTNPGNSTVKLLTLGNRLQKRTFLATTQTWATIRTQLSDYTPNDLASADSVIAAGGWLVLPENGRSGLGRWQGAGYVTFLEMGDWIQCGMVISGGYYGAYGGNPGTVNTCQLVQEIRPQGNKKAEAVHSVAADPVDMVTGAFVSQQEDIGSGGAEPLGYHFSRSYSSANSAQDGPLGYGWTHSYDIRLQIHSAYEQALGLRTPSDAASLLVASIALRELAAGSQDVRRCVTAAIVANWLTDAATTNAVTIHKGGQALTFVRRPDGGFVPPPGVTSSLVFSNGTFRLVERFGREWRFNNMDRLACIVDADGNTLTLNYNAQTNIQSLVDARGCELSFTWASERLQRVADNATGRAVEFVYRNDNGPLCSVRDVGGNLWTLTYDASNRLVTTADPFGSNNVCNVYDTQGRVAMQTNALGQTWQFLFAGTRTVDMDPTGGKKIYHYDLLNREIGREQLPGVRTWTVYDGQNHAIITVDANGGRTDYIYDSRQNLTALWDAADNWTFFDYDNQNRLTNVCDALSNRTTHVYDNRHHRIRTIRPDSSATEWTYTTNGLVQTEVVNAWWRWWPSSVYLGGMPALPADATTNTCSTTNTWTYDAWRCPATHTRPDGTVETFAHDAVGRLLARTDARTNTFSRTYDARGLVTSERDALGNVVSNVYDAAGQLTTVIAPFGRITRHAYNANRDLVATTYPDGSIVSNFYDKAGRLLARQDSRGGLTSNVYDNAGRVVVVTNALGGVMRTAYDGNGNAIAVTDPLNNVVSNSYDKLNRLVLSVGPRGATNRFAYDALQRLTNQTDEVGRRTTYEYDAMSRRTAVIRPDGVREGLDYDGFGNVSAVGNGLNKWTPSSFDRLGRQTNRTDTLGRVKTWRYDVEGNLVQTVNPAGRITTNNFDACNRVVETVAHDGSTDRWGFNAAGAVTGATDRIGFSAAGYDTMNRLTSWQDHNGLVVSNSYDTAGNLTLVRYPDGKIVRYEYDLLNRCTNIVDWANRATRLIYDAGGRLTQASYPNGVQSFYLYDKEGRLTNYWHKTGGTNFVARGIVRDAMGRKTRETVTAGFEVKPAEVWRTHNSGPCDQLRSFSRCNAYVQESWRITTPAWSADGCLTARVTQCTGWANTDTLAWDASARLTDFSGQLSTNWMDQPVPPIPQTLSYTYDAMGLLTRRVGADGAQRRFVYQRAGGRQTLLMEADSGNAATRYYIWAPRVGLVAQVEADGSIRYAHSDEQGSVLALTDAAGQVTDQFAYTPYGQLIARTGATVSPYQWLGAQGVRWEGSTLYQCGARFYDAALARFLSPDPLGFASDLNLYMYCAGNPVWMFDPSGLCADGGAGLYGWWDRLEAWSRNNVSESFQATSGMGWVGQGALLTAMELGHGIAAFPSAVAHLGEGSGTFAGDMTLENAAGVFRDLSTLASIGAMTAGALRPAAAATRAQTGGGLVHLTDDAAAAQIRTTGQLRGNIYAGPAANAELNGASLTARSGLVPGNYQAIPIPTAGEAAFAKPVPMGPFTAWQRATGQQFTSRGVMDINTGAFTREGVNWNQVGWYATDAAIWGGAGAGIYLGTRDE